MNKNTKLFGHMKGTKEIERNPINVKKVRDFVARYSDDDDLSFFGSSAEPTPVTSPATMERKSTGQAKRTRGKGSTLSFAGRTAETVLAKEEHTPEMELSQAAFPVIEFPTSSPQTHTNEEVNGLPVIAPWDSTAGAEPAKKKGSSFAMGSGSEFRILDEEGSDDELETPPLASFPSPTRDTASAPMTIEHCVTKAEVQEVQANAPSPAAVALPATPQEAPPSSSAKPVTLQVRAAQPRWRKKRTAVHLRKRFAASLPEAEPEEFVLSEEPEIRHPVISDPVPPLSDDDSAQGTGQVTSTAQVKEFHGRWEQGKDTHTVAWQARESALRQSEEFQSMGPQPHSANESTGSAPAALSDQADLDPLLVSFLAPDSFEAEQYRMLRYLVERLRGELGRACIVAVTSPSAGDGKTTTAINLAGALAQDADARVLLVDADLRRPSVKARLGDTVTASHGLADIVSQPRLKLKDVAVASASLNVTVIPAGQSSLPAYEVLKSPRIGALLEEARHQYDYIIVDTPPLVPVPDCRLIEKWVDGFFVVVAAHKTSRKLVQEALPIIDDAKMLGLVFNGGDPPVFGYDAYYGYTSQLAEAGSHRRKSA